MRRLQEGLGNPPFLCVVFRGAGFPRCLRRTPNTDTERLRLARNQSGVEPVHATIATPQNSTPCWADLRKIHSQQSFVLNNAKEGY